MPYFYEPFLEAFDPALRKQLGVWYTPAEVVRYMVARVDMALKDDLGIEDGLAADNVYVLDPCCGTGAFLAEMLRRIAANLEGRGLGALTGSRVKQAATQRVFGFEIMPALSRVLMSSENVRPIGQRKCLIRRSARDRAAVPGSRWLCASPAGCRPGHTF